MREDLTDITVVLDRSGSMGMVAGDTKHGFDQFVKEQKEVPGHANFTLVQFDTEYEFVHRGVPIREVPPLDFHPRGMTALLDAMGKAIEDTGTRLRNMSEYDRPSKVVFVIMTDGQENSSKEFTKSQINDMITRQKGTYKWQFVFLGANQDAIAEAAQYGIGRGQTMTFMATSAGIGNTMSATSNNVASFRKGSSSTVAYSDKDREEAMEE